MTVKNMCKQFRVTDPAYLERRTNIRENCARIDEWIVKNRDGSLIEILRGMNPFAANLRTIVHGAFRLPEAKNHLKKSQRGVVVAWRYARVTQFISRTPIERSLFVHRM